MSIASEITRLQNIKTAIRNALVNKGITSASNHDMADFATDISNIPSGGTYQSKTVSPTTSSQTVSPDTGYDALSSVTVNAIQTQTKSSSNLLAGGSVTLTPDTGKYITSATVTAASLASQTSGTASDATIKYGYTAWVNGVKVTGAYAPVVKYTFDVGESSSQSFYMPSWASVAILAAYKSNSSEPGYFYFYTGSSANRYGAINATGTWGNGSNPIQYAGDDSYWISSPNSAYAWTLYVAYTPYL